MKKSLTLFIVGALIGICYIMENGVPEQVSVKEALAKEATPLKVWVNNGEKKVPQQDLPLSQKGEEKILNFLWDGKKVSLFGGKNEVISFNLIIEAPTTDLNGLTFQFDTLSNKAGLRISNASPLATKSKFSDSVKKTQSAADIFDYNGRNIEIFIVRYLPIKGLSLIAYENYYDERHVPERFRRPHEGKKGTGDWKSRPDHDKAYPDIAVPQEVFGTLNIKKGNSQSVWVDIFIPKNTPADTYNGSFKILQNNSVIKEIPVALSVRNFTLPDTPSAKTMLYLGYSDIAKRYLGKTWHEGAANLTKLEKIRDRHFQMAHRHKISMIDDNEGVHKEDAPIDVWIPRLNGSLFKNEAGYNGPGIGVGNGVFSIGTYGKWDWGEKSHRMKRADNWAKWFAKNSPQTEYFLYLIDESIDYPKIEELARSFKEHSGIGRNLLTFATAPAIEAAKKMPSLDIACTTGGLGIPAEWEKTQKYYRNKKNGKLWFYNGSRPLSGSFMIEDDGVALRELAWAQYKHGIERWFYWESTYYNNFQGGTGESDVFKEAHTFGGKTKVDPVIGETGWNYGNGDGVLFYPGTDRVFPASSYNIEGPIASLRLKHWRRGLQDVDYLTLAAAKNPKKVQEIVSRVVPKTLWEYGVSDPQDPTWVVTDISWSTDPDVWEKARLELADIIEKK
ncbi:MAG: glycoside hydrolase domain-containing protein [Bdellovibrionota bacterium]|jgi:hypothetical protein